MKSPNNTVELEITTDVETLEKHRMRILKMSIDQRRLISKEVLTILNIEIKEN